MKLFVFSSRTLTNVWAGIGAGLWAISEQQAANVAGVQSKARKLRVGSAGVIYCSDTQSFTTPFLVLSKPEEDNTVRDVWPEPWTLPFKIHVLGTPHRQLHKDNVSTELPTLRSGNRLWNHVLLIQPTTVFVPSEIEADDWEVLMNRLGER